MGTRMTTFELADQVVAKCRAGLDELGFVAEVVLSPKPHNFVHGPVILGGTCLRMPPGFRINLHPDTFGYAIEQNTGAGQSERDWICRTPTDEAFGFCQWCGEELHRNPNRRR